MMTTLNLLTKSFKAKTPRAVVLIQKLLFGISAGSGAALTYLAQSGMTDAKLFTILTYIGVATAFAIPVLQFATNDKTVEDEPVL